jgi:hypothetical protein
VVWGTDETHVHLLPHVRATWILRPYRPEIGTSGKNRQATVFGALEMTRGQWVYRLGRRCAADFVALLELIRLAVPTAPAIVVICDNDSIHHAKAVTAYLDEHPPMEVLFGRRLRQIHAFFRARSPSQLLTATAPWTSPWLPAGYKRDF